MSPRSGDRAGRVGRAFVVRPLDATTWSDFARLVEANNGVWGGCWCMAFHPEGVGRSAAQHRAEKEARVRSGTAHAALVYDGDNCAGWCQFGPRDELPRIKHRKAYESEPVPAAGWRITCFFVGKGHRRQGVAAAALDGAIQEIARLGGGLVETIPESTEGRKVSSSFLWNGSVAMFERHGFERVRPLGKHHWLMTRLVAGGTQ